MARVGGLPRPQSSPFPAFDLPAPANEDIVVDIDDGAPALPSMYEEGLDGMVSPFEAEPELPSEDHKQNLAEVLDDAVLQEIGEEVVTWVEQDIEERAPWRDRYERGLEMLGLVKSDIDDGAFPGASNAVHPLLIEAVTQFWARAMAELYPPEGPCEVKVMGRQSQEAIARAARVKEYLNHELTMLDEGYLDETSRLIWAIPVFGSAFRKTYRDPVIGRNVGVYVPANDLIAPAEATSLLTAQRFTHRMRKSRNAVLQLQLAGFYRDIDLPSPELGGEVDNLEAAKNEAADSAPDDDEDSAEHVLFEMLVEYEIPGDEHVGEDGQPTGLKRPYIITVDRDSRTVLAIYRAWSENDELFRRKLQIEKFDFVPGFGFYGLGLFHLIGGLQTAATGALRVLLDGAASASLSGGFISKNANLKGKQLVSTPGMWQPVDASSEDLQKAFFPFPVKEPSGALFELMGFLTQAAQRFTATTELMTGGEDPKGSPVGTTVAMIEQGGKVMSTIHRMIHTALGRELRTRYQLCAEHTPHDGYPYEVDGEERQVYKDDFAPGLQIVPVSDPNIFSSAQRLSVAQTILQLALQTGVVNIKIAARRMLEAMRVADIDELIPPETQPTPYDPMGEIQALLLSKPILVLPEQPHAAHLQVLAAFISNPEQGGNPMVMQQIMPAVASTVAQHMAYSMVTTARMQGVPASYMDPKSGKMIPPGQEPQQGMLPPPGTPVGPEGQSNDVLGGSQPQQGFPAPGQSITPAPEQIAQMLAQIAPALAQAAGLPGTGPDQGEDKAAQAKIELEKTKVGLKAQESQQKMAFEREMHQLKLQMEQEKMELERFKIQQKAQIEQLQAQLKMQTESRKAQADIQQQEMKAQMDQQAMVREQQMNEQRMQQESQMQASEMASRQQMSQQELAMDQQAMQQQGQLKAQQASQDMQIKGQQASQKSKLDALRGPGGGGTPGGM